MSRILAFDTSGPWCTAVLMIEGRIVTSRHEEMVRGQAERLMPMLEEILADEGAVWEELDAIGVGVGPGNFTGIRIAVSAARGLALGLGIPAVGVTAFEAMRGAALYGDPTAMIVSIAHSRSDTDLFVQFFDGGRAVGGPRELTVFGDGIWTQDFEAYPKKALCHGFESQLVDWVLQKEKGGHEFLEFGPDYRQIEQIARVTALRLDEQGDIPRPAPLYVRPADAAPSSDPPPVILP